MQQRFVHNVFLCMGAILSLSACSLDEGALPPIEPANAFTLSNEQAELIGDERATEKPFSQDEEPSPSGFEEVNTQQGIPPSHRNPETQQVLTSLQDGSIVWSQFSGCSFEDLKEEEIDGPNSWVLYASNAASTVGLVVSIHRFHSDQVEVGHQTDLAVETRDAFAMIEIGAEIPSNFCVRKIKNIPVSTVLESTSGTVSLSRTEKGYQVVLTDMAFRDQFSKDVMQIATVTIPPQILVEPQ